MRDGDVVLMTTFKAWQPTIQASFKAPVGRAAVFLLLGDADKKAPDSFDPAKALADLGYVPQPAFDETAERAEFESDMYFRGMDFTRAVQDENYYASPYANGAWHGWMTCAKRKAGVL